jgi:hypothetical protein
MPMIERLFLLFACHSNTIMTLDSPPILTIHSNNRATVLTTNTMDNNNNNMANSNNSKMIDNLNILNIIIENFVAENFGHERKDTIMGLLGAIVVISLFIIGNNLINKLVGDDKPSSTKKINTPKSFSKSNSKSASSESESGSSFSPSSSGNGGVNGKGKTSIVVRKKKNKLPTFILGLIAFMGPRLYKLALTNENFVNKFDSIIDKTQLKLRNIVLKTSTCRDDDFLNKVDDVLDKFQIKLRSTKDDLLLDADADADVESATMQQQQQQQQQQN